MMGTTDLFQTALGDFADGDLDSTALAAEALILEGLAVLLIEPGGKRQWCTTPNVAQHPCGIHHAITDVQELTRPQVMKLLEAGVNLAVVPSRSTRRVVVVDLDTEAERIGFLSMWEEADMRAGVYDRDPEPVMTVASPGGGGHFWFTVPDDAEPLPASPGKLRGPAGWTVYYGQGHVLVPPSVRPEGWYRLTGPTREVPAWLLAAIRSSGS